MENEQQSEPPKETTKVSFPEFAQRVVKHCIDLQKQVDGLQQEFQLQRAQLKALGEAVANHQATLEAMTGNPTKARPAGSVN
jgi:hypothetical protein